MGKNMKWNIQHQQNFKFNKNLFSEFLVSVNAVSLMYHILTLLQQVCIRVASVNLDCLIGTYSENTMYEAIGNDGNGVNIGEDLRLAIQFADGLPIISRSEKGRKGAINKINRMANKYV